MYPANHPRGTSESERLIKQTYSVHVSLPADRARGIVRKWHLSKRWVSLRRVPVSSSSTLPAAYYSQQRLDSLATLDSIPGVGDVDVPEGWFKSARAGKTRRDHRDLAPKQPQALLDNPVGPTVKPPPSLSPDTSPNLRRHAPARCHLPSATRFVDDSSTSHHCSSSPSTDQSISPRQHSTHLPLASSGQLVPLQYLETVSYPRRDPIDEQLLRRFSIHPFPAGFLRSRPTV